MKNNFKIASAKRLREVEKMGEGPVCLDRLRRKNEGIAFNGENQLVRRFLSFNIVSEEVRAFLPKPGIAPWLTASFCASS